MKYRVFNTPVITSAARTLSRLVLYARGWTIVGEIPSHVKKCVVIGAPHTSNWDFPVFLMTAFALRINVHWMGKHTIFCFPLHSIMVWLGGIPVNRSIRGDLVAKATAMMNNSSEFIIGISPEGTRRPVSNWHTGFLYIAQNARVPIYLAFVDYNSKQCGILREFIPSGNTQNDLGAIKNVYRIHGVGKNPHNFLT